MDRRAVFGHDQRRLGKIENLPPLFADLRIRQQPRLANARIARPYARRSGRARRVGAAYRCDGLSAPQQRFVPLRTLDNQAELMRHRLREQLVSQRTALLNALRGHLSEIGVIAPQGAQHAHRLKRLAEGDADENGDIVVCGGDRGHRQ